jgi:hypothetical protein
MKYIKNHENFISNLFIKRKKLPVEVIELNQTLKNILTYYFNKLSETKYGAWKISSVEIEPPNKKHDNIISIYVDPCDLGGDAKIISLYYSREVENLMFHIFTQLEIIIMKDIKDFLINIIEKYRIPRKSVLNNYFIKLSDIQSIINEITEEKLDMFLLSNKFNI